MPTKAEKEPMRALYDRYNGLKAAIKDAEDAVAAANSAASSAAPRARNKPPSQATPPALPSRASTPASSTGSLTGLMMDGGVRGGQAAGEGHGDSIALIEQLKRDKRELHIMLKAYEQEFKAKHGREVSSPADIAPVEAEYQRYKEIKKRLARAASAS
ncbi:hypothetical protein JKP88DRAFT_226456 [Tribonema minus]|uniref:FAM13A-like domain-containing protein n=1 Tax=Tribonema minus TaxID=303371 RepID=A0A836C9U8_9STRA|nr:hypothetical protein JKP88DRAFT_226456 [Tribonema minus]